MGTLDDAIREHLELKRREGVSDDEIKEKESEAFGPGGRPPPPEPAAGPDERSRASSFEEELFEPDEVLPEESLEPNGAHAGGEDEAAFRTHELALGEADASELEIEEVEHRQDEDTADSEDLLEETPDFLEETPEHDRLWFEQKPPKDFDFD